MAIDLQAIHEQLSGDLKSLPGIFSTPQWGGRAWKLPGPGGNRKKPKLVAYVGIADDGKTIHVSFKLPKERAGEVVDRYQWIEPHGFKTLAPSGWVTAQLSRKRDVGTLRKLLIESRALYGSTSSPPSAKPSTASDPVARRIDAVMGEALAKGWRPQDE